MAFAIVLVALLFASSADAGASEDTGFVPPAPFREGMEPPPSPADPALYPGKRIWPAPRITHWPAVRFAGERRSIAFTIPVPRSAAGQRALGWKPGDPGSVGWFSQVERLRFVLPDDPDEQQVSGLVHLPRGTGMKVLRLELGETVLRLPLRLVDASAAWPLAGLEHEHPVDPDGTPVVLVQHDPPVGDQRLPAGWWELPPASGEALLLGDPLPSLGADAWNGVPGQRAPVVDARRPHHDSLVVLAGLARPLPRAIVWSPGNAPLHHGTWNHDEDRLLAVLPARCHALGERPRLLLALPPLPVDADLRELARERRAFLATRAFYLGWEVIDLADGIGGPETANRFAPGAYTRYPCREAQARMATVLRRALGDPAALFTCRLDRIPGIVYAGERWYLRFVQEGRLRAGGVTITGADVSPAHFNLAADGSTCQAWLPLNIEPGISRISWTGPAGPDAVALHVADLRRGYPIVAQRDGLPVDAQGRPVVLMAPRGAQRRLPDPAAFTPAPGPPLVLGDAPVVAELERRAGDEFAVIRTRGAAMREQAWPDTPPRVVCWAPGNAALLAGRWSEQEERLLGVLRYRRDNRAPGSRLMLVLPPWPEGAALQELASRRRALLRRSAFGQGWEVVGGEDPAAVLAAVRGQGWQEGLFAAALPISIYADEGARQFAVGQPADRLDGLACAGWTPASQQLFDLQDDGRALAWLPLPTDPGPHRLPVFIAGAVRHLALALHPQGGPWPVVGVRDGVPVDADGAAVVLVAQRHDPDRDRDWGVLRPDLPRPGGPAMIAGPSAGRPWAAPVAAAGVRVHAGEPGWSDPVHLIAALTAAGERPPRTFCWYPGNGAVATGEWTGEEERLLEVIAARFTALGVEPELLLLLPALPRDPAVRGVAERRRSRLRTQAAAHGWRIVDLETLARRHGPDARAADGGLLGPAAAALAAVLIERLR